MDQKYINNKLEALREEKQELEERLEYISNNETIEKIQEQIRELAHSIKEVEKWKANE